MCVQNFFGIHMSDDHSLNEDGDSKRVEPSKADGNTTPRFACFGPRLLTKKQAANYCALSPRGFASWVKVGRLPKPIIGTARWDRRAIDAALDDAMNRSANDNENPYDNWKARRHENKLKRNSHSKEEAR